MDSKKFSFNELLGIHSALVTSKEILLLSEEPKADIIYFETLESLDKAIEFFRSSIIEIHPDWSGVI